jgi:beta-lactam-binding protein with PASTA domain
VNLLGSTHARGLMRLVLLLPAIIQIACETTTPSAPPPFARVESVVRGNHLAAGPELQGLQITRGEAPLATVTGMPLQRGDRIVTDKGTEAVIVFEDAYEVILATDTAITISPDFFVEFGKAVVRKLKELRKKFQAETKYVNAGVEHTQFAISVDRQDEVSVVVLEGTVTLESTENRWSPQTIGPRQGAVVRAGQPPTRRERVTQTELDRTFGWARRVEDVAFPAEVPDLIGRPVADARGELSRAGLAVGSIQNVAGQPVGTVVRQSRPAGQRVRYGTSVDLDVAAEISVPNVLGMTQLEAGIALGFAGLNVGEISEENDTGARPGRVARQYPAPGTRVPPGTPVSLVIASRRAPPPPPPPPPDDWGERHEPERGCTVPDIRYASEENAAGILREQGLRLGSVRRVEGRRAVVSQNPQPGARVRCGSSVDLLIHSAPLGTHDAPPETICTVPDLRQVPPDKASGVLRKYNLQLGRVQRVEGRSAGVAQNPEPGTRVRCGSSVDLVIYSGPSGTHDAPPETMCTVPDLRQVPVERAAAFLRKYNLQLGRVQRVEGRSAGMAQNPEPGTRVRCGSSVDLVVYSGASGTYDGEPVTMCTVPDIRRLTARAAQSALKASGLRLGQYQQGGDDRRQNPEPGKSVQCGSTVDVFAVFR